MKKPKKSLRVLSSILSVATLSSLVVSCSKKEESTALTYWMAMDSATAAQYTDYGETEIAKALEERLGIDVEYIHPPTGQSAEKFNIMMAQTDLPDIIEASWDGYPGGMGNAIEQGKVIDIAQHLDKAPNLKKFLEEHEDIARLIYTDDGKLIGFPFVRVDDYLRTSAGLMIRKDWLDELGLPVPETIDEWETMLRAFKEKKNSEAPLTMTTTFFDRGVFVGAYGETAKTYVEDGIVKYGPSQPGFKEFLKTMNKWYKEGLLDNAIATQDSKGVNANILGGISGATINSTGGGMGMYLTAATEEGFDLVAAPYPVLNKGETPKFGDCSLQCTAKFAAISSSCKDIDKAIKLLDYAYSEEGGLLYNFGIEGVSYEMVDGYPTYTEVITNNSEGKSMAEAMAAYLRASGSGPFVQDRRYMEQYAATPQQKNAIEVWSATNAADYLLPYIYPERASDLAKLQTAVNTYYQEMLVKFIMGLEPIENFDKFVDELNAGGLQEILELQQAAYEKYLER